MVKLGVRAQNPKVPQPPNFDPHCSNSTKLIFAKFSASSEHPRCCRTPSKNRKSVDRVPCKSRPNFAKKQNFKPPYLPQMGADSPKLKTIFIRVNRAINRKDHMGVRGPNLGVFGFGRKIPPASRELGPNFRRLHRALLMVKKIPNLGNRK